MEHRPEWIPVTTFYKEGLASFLAERTRDQPDVQALYYPNFEKLQKLDAIRSYPYYMNEVTEPDIENVVEIFNG